VGDSGDPAIVQVGPDSVAGDPSPGNGTWRLVAIVIFGEGECERTGYADLTVASMRSVI
jgi:hypothetical protein